jgi:hypothetical protein
MKKLSKYASGLFFAGVLSLLFMVNADAQRGAFHGGGGGVVRIGGGGGFGGGFRVGVGGFYRPGVGYFGYPHIGFYLGALPFGYYPFYYGPYQYYYADGIFYSPYAGGGYQVTTPPVGAAVPSLPRAAKSIMIDNQQYYEFNGVYYKIVVNDKGQNVYVVAGKDGVLNTDGSQQQDDNAPKVGDIVDQLPDNCRRVTLNGKKYFVATDDIYYEQIKDNNGNVAYRIASIPDDQPNDQQPQQARPQQQPLHNQ